MTAASGRELSQLVRERMAEFFRMCEKVDEQAASRAPDGRWSPRQIVSHVSGPEESGQLGVIKAFLEKDEPQIELKAENPFYTPLRASMTFGELVAGAKQEYDRVAGFVEGLSEEQLERRAHVPVLKDTPIGDHPTLEAWIRAIIVYHLEFHTNHLREILEALGVVTRSGAA